MTDKTIEKIFDESISIISKSKKNSNQIKKTIDTILQCHKKGGKIIVFGNGGSAADSQHFAAEFVGRFQINRKAIPAISFTTDTSILTAIGNDYTFDDIFARQCEALVGKNDIVIGLSTSGTSKNVINGLKMAKKQKCKTIGILGNDGGSIKKIVDISIIIPSRNTARIQEAHRIILHIICDKVEEKLFTTNHD